MVIQRGDGTLRSMRLDAMAALGVGPEGQPTNFYAGYLGDMDEAGSRDVLLYGPLRPYKLPQKALMQEIYLADDRFKSSTKAVEEARPERAILVGLESDAPYDTLAELGELAATAGAVVVGRATQRKRDIDNATYIGSGKAELSLSASALEADLLIFDDELSPAGPEPGGHYRGAGHRPHGAHFGYFRPARPEPGRQAPGGACPIEIRAAPDLRPG